MGWVELEAVRYAVWGELSAPRAHGRCTVSDRVGPLEHLSAAALCIGARGWVLRVEHPDLPLFDGSAETWRLAFAEVFGPDQLPRPLEVETGLGAAKWESERGGFLSVEPSEHFHLKVEWTRGPDGPECWEGEASRLGEVLLARTFVDADDWLKARRLGFLKGTDEASGRLFRGANPSSDALELAMQLGVDPDRMDWSPGTPRLKNECAAHKAMDLVGDIGCWIGYLPKLSIHARDAGHDLHHLLGSALRGSTGEV